MQIINSTHLKFSLKDLFGQELCFHSIHTLKTCWDNSQFHLRRWRQQSFSGDHKLLLRQQLLTLMTWWLIYSLVGKKNALRHHHTLYDDIIPRDMSNASFFLFPFSTESQIVSIISHEILSRYSVCGTILHERQRRCEKKPMIHPILAARRGPIKLAFAFGGNITFTLSPNGFLVWKEACDRKRNWP